MRRGGGMEMTANAMRFASTAIVMKEPVLVGLAIVFVVGLLSTQYDPDGVPIAGIWGWLGLAAGLTILLGICAIAAWLLCSSIEVVIDPATRRVTQWYRFLKYETAKNEWAFADFTGVRVEQKTSKEESAATSPGSRGAQTSVKTTYTHSYALYLLRADTQMTLPDRQLTVPHSPLDLPMEQQTDPRVFETAALQVARLGGWPAKRRGYALMKSAAAEQASGHQYLTKTLLPDAESRIEWESQ